MNLRGWGNAFAVAGLILAFGAALAQAPQGNVRYWTALGVSLVLAVIAIALLRPNETERDALKLAYLLTKLSDREIAFLLAGSRAITYPGTLSEHTVALAPRGEDWLAEPESVAEKRAQKLIALGLMNPRGSEVETSALGRALVTFDEQRKIERVKANRVG